MESLVEWFVSFNEFTPLWRNQSLFIVVQLSFLFGTLATLIHASQNRRQWPGLWFVVFLNGLFVEVACFFIPQVNNFWHSQTPIMFFEKRLPLYILCFYPCVYYTAAVAASLMNLPRKIEPLAVGMLAILIDLPFEIIGVKYLFYSWHDSDPTIQERTYGVPWVNYIFHFIFAGIIRTLYSENQKPDVRKSSSKKVCGTCRNKKGIASALIFSMPLTTVITGIVHSVPHDIFNLPSRVSSVIFLVICACLIWSADTISDKTTSTSGSKGTATLILFLTIHFGVSLIAAVFSDPRDQISDGLHQPIGNCSDVEPLYSILGTIVYRNTFLCLDDHNVFDFHCTPNFTVPEGKVVSWYTICGTSHSNKNEFVSLMLTISIAAFIIFRNIFYKRPEKYRRTKTE